MDLARFGLERIQRATTLNGVVLYSGMFGGGEYEMWLTLRDAHPRTGLWPVLGWTAEEAAEATGQTERWRLPAGLLDAALGVDPTERMAEVIEWSSQSDLEDHDVDHPGHDECIREVEAGIDSAALVLEMTATRQSAALPGSPVARKEHGFGSVLLVTARAGFEVPVLVPDVVLPANWFGVSAHPDLTRADHVAVLRYWHERYGAELYTGRGSNLELVVTRPPTAPLDIARCAIEQYAYCSDLSQTIGDPVDVALRQAPASHWKFWWD